MGNQQENSVGQVGEELRGEQIGGEKVEAGRIAAEKAESEPISEERAEDKRCSRESGRGAHCGRESRGRVHREGGAVAQEITHQSTTVGRRHLIKYICCYVGVVSGGTGSRSSIRKKIVWAKLERDQEENE